MIDFWVNFKLNVGSHEIDVASAGQDYAVVSDTVLGRYVALTYDYSNNQWVVKTNTGQQVIINTALIGGAWNGFALAFHPVTGGVRVRVRLGGVLYGELVTLAPMNFNSIQFGSLHNSSLERVEHQYTDIRVGSAPNLSDIFNADLSSGTVVPPFDSETGEGISAIGTDHPYLLFNIPGFAGPGSNSYVTKAINTSSVPVVPPPGPPPHTGTIVITGDDIFKNETEAKYSLNAWDMDRLLVPMRGSLNLRDALLDSLVMWSAHQADGNMFLSDVVEDEHSSKVFPKISLVYIGKRNGVLPPDKNTSGEQLQQVSARSTFNTNHTIGVSYISKSSEKIVWSREPIELSSVEPLEPADIDAVWLTETDVVIWTGDFETYQAAINAALNNIFVARTITTGVSEELVPGRYYRATRSRQRMLFPILT